MSLLRYQLGTQMILEESLWSTEGLNSEGSAVMKPKLRLTLPLEPKSLIYKADIRPLIFQRKLSFLRGNMRALEAAQCRPQRIIGGYDRYTSTENYISTI